MKKPTPFGKYYLLEGINVGGMAEVFRAEAFGVGGFERLVAVKRILPNIAEDKEFIRMFIEEAKLAVQLNHANIAQIFDLGVVDGSYYIALEHVHGRDLRAMFDRGRQLGDQMPVSQACFVEMKVCEGLDYAHNKRDRAGRELYLVHRDVSETRLDRLPKVSYFTMGTNEWRSSDSWPPAGARERTFYLASGGRANSLYGDGALAAASPDVDRPDTFTYDPANPVRSARR